MNAQHSKAATGDSNAMHGTVCVCAAAAVGTAAAALLLVNAAAVAVGRVFGPRLPERKRFVELTDRQSSIVVGRAATRPAVGLTISALRSSDPKPTSDTTCTHVHFSGCGSSPGPAVVTAAASRAIYI